MINLLFLLFYNFIRKVPHMEHLVTKIKIEVLVDCIAIADYFIMKI
ncbi:hypothetical protein SIN_2031 [Streptococcus infantis SK1302]|uniref:Uncharacterized protein n=1 Tax=Streptococcus infantis SK1302 TaxID=871237 RepID=A0ABP2J0W4_9STRE|nr:hypothetical protein SIN_2031 [Streptococcus infantis SK1302]